MLGLSDRIIRAICCPAVSRALARPPGRKLATVTQAHVQALADAVGSWAQARRFDLLVVGSVLDADGTPKDLDVIVRPRKNAQPRIAHIELLLLRIEWFGLKRLNISIDATYRSISEEEVFVRARHGERFVSIKLYARKWRALMRSNPDVIQPVGRCLVEIHRRIDETSYFHKLPLEQGGSGLCRRLRAGVPLSLYQSPP